MPENSPPHTVLAIDPGTRKCGIALVTRTPDGTCHTLFQKVVDTAHTLATITPLLAQYQPQILLIGAATGSKPLRKTLSETLTLPILVVPEEHTTERARIRYWKEHPPRGLRRLLPVTLQTPPVPYDDYAAILLAETYLQPKP